MRLYKILAMTAIAMTALTAASCSGRDGIDGRDGLDGRDGKDGMDGVMNWDVYEENISDWKLIGDVDAPGSYYTHEMNDDLLTSFIADSSNVIVYCKYENNDGNLVWSPMSVVRHYTETVRNAANTADSTVLFTQTYDYEFKEGLIRFAITRSDFKTSNIPEPMNVRIVYNW